MLILFIVAQFVPFEAATAAVVQDRFSPPNMKYPFGTDGMGRNLFMRIIYAARFSLPIGFGATSVAAFIGVVLGSHAAYYGGVIDDVIMRFCDVLASIPGILLGMVIISALGASITNLIIAVGVSSTPLFIRTSRASLLSVKSNEYVEAARAVGLSNYRIIFTQVLPNGLAPIMISFSIALGMSILVSASLSFLGLGIPVPNPEWGSLVSSGRDYVRNAPWLTAVPGVFIMVTVMGFNMLGDGLRDALDPKLKR
jgi:peptide/nickel transport system permease protein